MSHPSRTSWLHPLMTRITEQLCQSFTLRCNTAFHVLSTLESSESDLKLEEIEIEDTPPSLEELETVSP